MSFVKCQCYNTLTLTNLTNLFTDASKYSYSGILHQEKEGNADTLIPIAYFQVVLEEHSSSGIQHRKNAMQSTNLYKSFHFFLTGAECTPCCDHKTLAPFLTTGMSNHVLDRWALELQQFNIKFNHIEGKKKHSG